MRHHKCTSYVLRCWQTGELKEEATCDWGLEDEYEEFKEEREGEYWEHRNNMSTLTETSCVWQIDVHVYIGNI